MIDSFALGAPTRELSGKTNCYVVGEPGSENCLLVDPPARDEALTETVEGRVGHVLATHHHPDHVGAVESYATEFDLTVWALRGRASPFESATGIRPDRLFFPGETIPAAGGVTIIDTPGHAPEHVAIAVSDAVVSGDLALSEGSVVVGAPEGDMRAYLSSLRRVYARDPERLYPGHGPTIENPRETCERLLQHRLDREQRVLATIHDGAQTVDEIVETAYEKDISAVYDLARATVVAHIEKLAVENKVSDGRDGTVRPAADSNE